MPVLAQSAARETSPSKASGLPYRAMPLRSPTRMQIDYIERQIAFILFQILQLRPEPGPTSGTGAIHAQRAADAIIDRAT